MVHDNGNGFTGCELQILTETYGNHPKPTTAKITRSNTIVEIIHLIMVDMLRADNFTRLH